MSSGRRDDSGARPPPLRKGQACSTCRRRKQRCDGTRPTCGQCIAHGRALDCEYADPYTPTRSEVLQDYLARLQRRAETAEGNDPSPSSSVAVPRSRVPARWWESDVTHPQVLRVLVDSFLQHSYQTGWALDNNRIYASLAGPPTSATYPIPALVNAMCLWGAHAAFLQDPTTMTAIGAPPQTRSIVEQAYFNKVTTHVQDQTDQQSMRRGVQLIQAEIMLATYLFSMGDVVGAGILGTDYHVNAAVRLAMGLRLHNFVPRAATSASGGRSGRDIRLDVTEENERIALFWRVFCLDRQWAAAQARPALLRLEGDGSIVVTTPWPVAPHEYAQPTNADLASGLEQPLKQFVEEQGSSTVGFSFPAIIAKACFLCDYAHLQGRRSSSTLDSRDADAMIFAFISSLAPLEGSAPTALKARFVGIHATAYMSFIRLHENNAPSDVGAFARCFHAARCISALVGILGPDSVLELDPFAMPCFVLSCKVLMRAITRMQQLQVAPAEKEMLEYATPDVLVDELDRMMLMLSSLRPVYPVVESQLNSLSEMREQMQI